MSEPVKVTKRQLDVLDIMSGLTRNLREDWSVWDISSVCRNQSWDWARPHVKALEASGLICATGATDSSGGRTFRITDAGRDVLRRAGR